MSKLERILNNKYKNHIRPLFWQHGESEEVINDEIEKIYNAGIKEFCVEARPFDEFCGNKWWRNMDNIIAQCKRLGMRVWIFDDSHFPTGYANGALEKDNNKHLRKWFLIEKNMDVIGPQKDAAVIYEPILDAEYEETLVSVVAMKRSGNGEDLTEECINLTHKTKNGMIWFDVPTGIWRVFFLIKTRNGADGRFSVMVDNLNSESTEMMIKEVYQPHYERYKEYFGNTIAVFFTDEAGFYNRPLNYEARLGNRELAVPWADSLIGEMSTKCGFDVSVYLPAFWYNIGEKTKEIRYAYMDTVSQMYSENFCFKIGNWCREHGVEYIGHVLEDMNISSGLGSGAGHYFRALAGQDMAGIDVVYHQLLPGFGDMSHAIYASSKNNNPALYDFTLGKLGSSMAHIQPNKKGRAMLEIFGAYGWAEGMPLMKWMVDHFIVSGINEFVPHAFSPKYPDFDCPPHFYARGYNNQYPYMKQLMDYMNRTAELFSDGIHIPTVAVLYHAEAAWMGGKVMYEQEIAKILSQNQIDYDIIPMDSVMQADVLENGDFIINEVVFKTLIVPYAQYLPKNTTEYLLKMAQNGARIVFTEQYPDNMERTGNCRVVKLKDMKNFIADYTECKLSYEFKDVRYYHYKSEISDIYMLNNESIFETYDGKMSLPLKAKCLIYNPMDNEITEIEHKDGKISCKIEPYNNLIIIENYGNVKPNKMSSCEYDYYEPKLRFDISLKENMVDDEFRTFAKNSLPINITTSKYNSKFCGEIKYETTFNENESNAIIDLGEVGEVAQLWLNDNDCGIKICPPYRFKVKLQNGSNHLKVIVANNSAYRERDKYSRFIMLKPSGIIGPIKIGKMC